MSQPPALPRDSAGENLPSVDQQYLWQTLRLAEKALGHTRPNPLVGAVVVRDGEVVGTGYHQRAGEAHGEAAAIVEAGERCEGATLYVNLEPCCHHGRRAPCTDLIISSKIRRVVAGTLDPNPLVNGRGFAALRAAGIEVSLAGPRLRKECIEVNAAFFRYITDKRPLVTAKYAMSLDGKIATKSGDSKWITGPEARAYAHELRATHDAVLVGSGTLAADNPSLNVRLNPGARQPLRVVLVPREGGYRVDTEWNVLTTNGGPTLLVVPHEHLDAANAALAGYSPARAKAVGVAATEAGHIDVGALFATLAGLDIMSVLVEGGGTLLSSLWEASLVDRVTAFVAPVVVGGRDAKTPFDGVGAEQIADAVRLEEPEVRRLGRDLAISAWVQRPTLPEA
ncbi:MAG: bifunctional diaminohydroxyphosphoribosylaminopyrimidine deaminase/5-amino-6-(5-phosphoribosylamino)uracil reductase RibD, partial [Myxococcales bacterium]|nr:bifunctional diaminohydroxyphosphoribosylaminopyrimidine deaminase/5-amino-6-(5-phosphoribosylamino)uracil reductase RibD [Myxococcales bacterium]